LSIEDLPSLGQTFDFIACNDVLYLLPDPVAGLRSMKAVLKPQGIMRANLHSLHQRQFFYYLQNAMKVLGVMTEPTAKAVPIVREILDALHPDSLNKPLWSNEAKTVQGILMNFLMQGDKGSTIPDLFSMLEQAELQLIRLVNWPQWDLSQILQKPTPLADRYLASLSLKERLHLVELLYPNLSRLIDFWCGPILPTTPKAITPNDWWYGTVYLHPLLSYLTIETLIEQALREYGPVEINGWPGSANPITLSYSVVAWLAPLLETNLPVQALVSKAQQILEIPAEAAFTHVTTILSLLEQSLIILLDSPLW
jgi:hypothetical protein